MLLTPFGPVIPDKMWHLPLGFDMLLPRWSHWGSSCPDAGGGEEWAGFLSHVPGSKGSPGASPHPWCRSQTPPSCSHGQKKDITEICLMENKLKSSAVLITNRRKKEYLGLLHCRDFHFVEKSTRVNIKDHCVLFKCPSKSLHDSEAAWTISGPMILLSPVFFLLWQNVFISLALPRMHFKMHKASLLTDITACPLLYSWPFHVS